MSLVDKKYDSAIIIVDFNTMQRTVHYIEDSQDNFISNQLLYVVVENGSENDEKLKERFFELKGNLKDFSNKKRIVGSSLFRSNSNHTIIFLKAKENYGFAISNNIGAECASNYLKDDGLYIFSNNDIIFTQLIDLNYYTNRFKKDYRVGLIGPKVIGLDGSCQSPYKYIGFGKRYIRTFILWPLDRVLLRRKPIDDIIYNSHNGSSPYRVIGAFMIFSKEVFEKIGMFDEQTFMYYEESIISEKLQRANKIIIYDDTYSIVHEGGATTSNVFTTANRLKIEFDSAIYYYRKYKDLGTASAFISKGLFLIYLMKRKLFYKKNKRYYSYERK